jgi:hypothetical protein
VLCIGIRDAELGELGRRVTGLREVQKRSMRWGECKRMIESESRESQE